MTRPLPAPDRNVLPVRQDMHGDEIDRARKLAVAQPELPDVGIGDRHLHLRLHARDVFAQGRQPKSRRAAALRCRRSPRGSVSGYRLAIAMPVVDLHCVRSGRLESQSPSSTFRPCRCAISGIWSRPCVDRIDAHAIGDFRELGEVLARSAGHRSWSSGSSGFARHGTARRTRSRASRPDASGDGGIGTRGAEPPPGTRRSPAASAKSEQTDASAGLRDRHCVSSLSSRRWSCHGAAL